MSETDQKTFRFLQHLAADLSAGKVAFTTFADATVKVRLALNDPRMTADQLAATITAEPLLPTRLLRVANSAALNPSGVQVSDIKGAVMRVGHSTIRSIAVNVALSQLSTMKDLEPFADEAQLILHHSAEVAAIAYVIARRMTRTNADEALFAGLVHDIGRFYLLSRIAKYPELQGEPEEVAGLVTAWHPAAGHAILVSLGVPDQVSDAVNRHEDDDVRIPPKDLADVLNIANRVSHSPNPLNQRSHNSSDQEEFVAPDVFDVLEASADDLRALADSLRA
jgi:putative nucleotidyltransferase with HDIG domain